MSTEFVKWQGWAAFLLFWHLAVGFSGGNPLLNMVRFVLGCLSKRAIHMFQHDALHESDPSWFMTAWVWSLSSAWPSWFAYQHGHLVQHETQRTFALPNDWMVYPMGATQWAFGHLLTLCILSSLFSARLWLFLGLTDLVSYGFCAWWRKGLFYDHWDEQHKRYPCKNSVEWVASNEIRLGHLLMAPWFDQDYWAHQVCQRVGLL